MSIKGIDQHSTTDALSTNDPKNMMENGECFWQNLKHFEYCVNQVHYKKYTKKYNYENIYMLIKMRCELQVWFNFVNDK